MYCIPPPGFLAFYAFAVGLYALIRFLNAARADIAAGDAWRCD